MKLLYPLPRDLESLLDSPPVYCVPFDLTSEGGFAADGQLAVTTEAVYVLADGQLRQRTPLADLEEVLCAPQMNCGMLIAKDKEGTERLLCRFSMRHLVRHSYVARGATFLIKGENRSPESKEREKYCEKCGRVLPGTTTCPHCDGRNVGLNRFWDLCKPYAPRLLLITVFMLFIAALTVGQQYVQRLYVDTILVPATGSLGIVLAFFGVMLGFMAVILGLSITRTLWSNYLGTHISRDLRKKVFSKLSELSLSFIDQRQSGELMNRVVEDSGRIRQFMEEVFAGMFTQLFTMVGAVIMMLMMDWKLTLLTVALLPIVASVIRGVRKREMRNWRQQWRFDDRLNNRLQDIISGMRVVKSFGQEAREVGRFQKAVERLRDIQQRNEAHYATVYPIITYLLTAGSFFVLFFGGLSVLNGTMTVGQLTQFSACAGMLYGPLGWLTRLPRMIMQLTTALERIYDVLDEDPEVAQTDTAQEREINGNVTFDNAGFGYLSYEPVLKNLSFEVKQGEMIGLVGSSGAGKSTLINLIMRLYDVNEGRILLDGVDLREYDKRSLHSQIGVVLQETFLFSGTVYENIRFARQDATREEIIRAAKLANAHEFIVRFPDGYDTYVGEHGYRLSGGERQRIAIARAVLHAPQLLILDEATSSLDTETEYQIQEALERLTKGRTTFAIAHRLSTLRSADRIVVIDQHTVAEIGTHDELIRRKGIYYGLVMAQLEMSSTKAAE